MSANSIVRRIAGRLSEGTTYRSLFPEEQSIRRNVFGTTGGMCSPEQAGQSSGSEDLRDRSFSLFLLSRSPSCGFLLFDRFRRHLLPRQLWGCRPGSIDWLVCHEVRVDLVRTQAGNHFALSARLRLQVVVLVSMSRSTAGGRFLS